MERIKEVAHKLPGSPNAHCHHHPHHHHHHHRRRQTKSIFCVLYPHHPPPPHPLTQLFHMSEAGSDLVSVLMDQTVMWGCFQEFKEGVVCLMFTFSLLYCRLYSFFIPLLFSPPRSLKPHQGTFNHASAKLSFKLLLVLDLITTCSALYNLTITYSTWPLLAFNRL